MIYIVSTLVWSYWLDLHMILNANNKRKFHSWKFIVKICMLINWIDKSIQLISKKKIFEDFFQNIQFFSDLFIHEYLKISNEYFYTIQNEKKKRNKIFENLTTAACVHILAHIHGSHLNYWTSLIIHFLNI